MKLAALNLILMLSLGLSQASAGVSSPFLNCQALFLSLTHPLPKAKPFNLSAETLGELRAAKLTLDNSYKKRERNSDAERIPAEFEIGGESYKYISYLGSGGEGHVYLVEKAGERFSFKQFGMRDVFKDNLALMKRLKLRGLDITEPLVVDRKNMTALSPYVYGLPMHLFFWPEHRADSSPLVALLKPETFKYIQGLFLQWEQSTEWTAQYGSQSANIPVNVILDLDNLKFQIIDPR